ncbi:MAG: polysaccharide deacetylase family protein, partial [Phycisphaerae bacterium]|nr:polysaccharide deacetylase family protein [Phycisphaerae bacterium]
MRYPKIIYYHDIATCMDDCPPRCYGPTIGQFREHVAYLQSRFNILDPLELVDCCKSGRFPRKPSVAITFDDGLSGAMLAAEVLAEAKLPALVFLATRFIDTREHPWFVHLDDLILEAAKRRKPLSISGREFSMNTISNRMPFRRRAKMLLLGRPYNEQVTALTEWADEIGWRLGEGREDQGTFLSWRQVEELAGSGFHFASHTHSHVDLRVLSDEELDKEFAKP